MGQGQGDKVYIGKCCFCLNLKTGVMVLGILSSIAAAIGLVAYVIALIAATAGRAYLQEALQQLQNQLNQNQTTIETTSNVLLAIAVIGTIICAVHLVASILLAVGAKKGKQGLLIPWLVMCISTILWCILAIILAFAYAGDSYPWGNIVSYLVSIVLQVYFWVVVLSLYNELKSGGPAPQIA